MTSAPVQAPAAFTTEDYLARVKSHPDLFSVTVPVGKGEEVSYKLR